MEVLKGGIKNKDAAPLGICNCYCAVSPPHFEAMSGGFSGGGCACGCPGVLGEMNGVNAAIAP